MTKLKTDASLLQSCVSVSVTDLRIGNYISRLDLGSGAPRTEQILELLSKRAVTSGPCKVIVLYEDIKPIPLTEEWLLRFKFNNNHWATKWILEDMPIPTGIEYVHQLQNLYHALTGSDLQDVYLTEH